MIKDLPEGQTQYEGTGGPSELSAGFGGVSPAPTFEDELLDLLAMMFDAYEDGPDCYEDPEDCSGYIGKAIHLDDDAFHRISDILNTHRPRNTAVTPAPTFADGMMAEDDRRFLELTNDLTHNAEVTGFRRNRSNDE